MRVKYDVAVGSGPAGLPAVDAKDGARPPAVAPADQPYRATKGNREVILRFAASAADQRAIYDGREQAYRAADMAYLLHEGGSLHPAQDRFDAGSYHFSCHENGRLVGSVRHTPAVDEQWESPEITRMSAMAPFEQDEMLQLGRLVVAADCRGRMLSEMLVWASSAWIHRHAPHRGYYSVCVPRLAQFYEHFGTTTVEGSSTTLAERHGKVYLLIHATHDGSRRALDRFLRGHGWELHDPAKGS